MFSFLNFFPPLLSALPSFSMSLCLDPVNSLLVHAFLYYALLCTAIDAVSPCMYSISNFSRHSALNTRPHPSSL
ncbi:hypothetical protein K523DRAFT_325322 [Schizophyllum commune Tattone D]|nr:hypothetical protein K523DRAFT_325322 [Schizophyllum commune Tattone D]